MKEGLKDLFNTKSEQTEQVETGSGVKEAPQVLVEEFNKRYGSKEEYAHNGIREKSKEIGKKLLAGGMTDLKGYHSADVAYTLNALAKDFTLSIARSSIPGYSNELNAVAAAGLGAMLKQQYPAPTNMAEEMIVITALQGLLFHHLGSIAAQAEMSKVANELGL